MAIEEIVQVIQPEIWYRFEDRRYSYANEDGDHEYTSYEVALRRFVVEKHTP